MNERPAFVADAEESPTLFTPTPFVWRHPAVIPRRPFLYGRHLIRGFLSRTVARAGTGKTSLTIADAVAMASGRNLVGAAPAGPLNVWIINLEDPLEEADRRIHATLAHYGID